MGQAPRRRRKHQVLKPPRPQRQTGSLGSAFHREGRQIRVYTNTIYLEYTVRRNTDYSGLSPKLPLSRLHNLTSRTPAELHPVNFPPDDELIFPVVVSSHVIRSQRSTSTLDAKAPWGIQQHVNMETVDHLLRKSRPREKSLAG